MHIYHTSRMPELCYMQKSLKWLGRLVVRALDLQLDGCEFDDQTLHCQEITLGKLFTPTCLCRSQWFSG